MQIAKAFELFSISIGGMIDIAGKIELNIVKLILPINNVGFGIHYFVKGTSFKRYGVEGDFLRKIPKLKITRGLDLAALRLLHAHYDLQECRLSGSVSADNTGTVV